jgi:hypothetical protein
MDKARKKELSDATKARWEAYRAMRRAQAAPFESAKEAQRLERESQQAARGEEIRRNFLIDSLKTVSYEDAKEQGHLAEWHESDPPNRLVIFGTMWDKAKRSERDTQITGEVFAMCLAWAHALRIISPINPGTTLRDLARRVFYEWQRQNKPLMNPETGKLSPGWTCKDDTKPDKVFEDVWEFTETGDYNKVLEVVYHHGGVCV